jgi:hypothetical protein
MQTPLNLAEKKFMNDSIFRIGTWARLLRNLLLLGVLAVVWGCASKPRSAPVTDGQGRLHGHGFTITPPQGKDWTVAEKADDSVVYLKSPDSRNGQDSARKVLAQASLGVVTLPAEGTASAEDEAGFARAAQNFLSNRFVGQSRVSLMDLKTAPYSLNGALCARFEAVQVERRSTRRNSTNRLEFLNRGFLCRHPDNRTVVVHGFFNKASRHLTPKSQDAETEKEADSFLEGVILSPLR